MMLLVLKKVLKQYEYSVNWDKKTIIHDGEKSIINAWDTATKYSISHGLCMLHFKDNIERKLNQLSITDKTVKLLIFAPLFGLDEVKGFVDELPVYIDTAISEVESYWYVNISLY